MKSTIQKPIFPPDFLWGVATSSHQIEGNSNNDWTDWEEKHSLETSNKSKFQNKDYISGIAADSWNRYEEDHQIIKDLGLNAYRFSLEWSRIEPVKGDFSIEAIKHYLKMLQSLKEKGIKPVVTLWHWTLPKWLAAEGGVNARDAVEYFVKYTNFVLSHLTDYVEIWITINEPLVYAHHSYLKGDRPPNQKNLPNSYKAVRKLIQIHNQLYDEIKSHNSDSLIGSSKSIVVYQPYKDRSYNRFITKLLEKIWNHYFVEKTIKNSDFIGMNYYTKAIVDITGQKKGVDTEEGMKWYYNPCSIYEALKSIEKYNKPIYITENGLSDGQDQYRPEYLRRVNAAIIRALNDGIDLRGYFHWSLLDNFEWDSGFGPKFGLVGVDRVTKNRIPKNSASVYSDIVKDSKLLSKVE